jgi:hypothetical protein
MRRLVVVALLAISTPAASQYSGKYGCTKDCSGHQAGYAWAQKKRIDDPAHCRGKSQSFVEGCLDYVDQLPQEEAPCPSDDQHACEQADDSGPRP